MPTSVSAFEQDERSWRLGGKSRRIIIGIVVASALSLQKITDLQFFRRTSILWGSVCLTCFFAFRRLCWHLNRAERHCSEKAIIIEASRTAPPFGSGLKKKESGWKKYLQLGLDAEECLEEICTLVGVEPAALSEQQVVEAVRRLLLLGDPTRPAKCAGIIDAVPDQDSYWSEEDCSAIAQSLLREVGVAPSDDCSSRKIQPAPYFPPRPTPAWIEVVQLGVNALGGLAMNMLGLQSKWLTTQTCVLHYFDSGLAPTHADQVPMVLVHGMFTTAVSMGVLASFLMYSRRVFVLDLPDFDYSCSRVLQNDPLQPRIGGPAHHIEAVVELVETLLSSGECKQVDLCGHSFGGYIAASASEKLGSSVRHLHLLAPARTGATRIFAPIAKGGGLASNASTFTKLFIIRPVLDILRSPNTLNFIAAAGVEDRRISGKPWACRSHVVFGDRDNLVVPRATSKVQSFFPNGEAWMFKGARHQFQLFSAGGVCDMIEAFAARNGGCGAPLYEPCFRRLTRRLLHNDTVSLLFANT